MSVSLDTMLKKSGIPVLKQRNFHFFLFLKVIWRSRSNHRHLKSCMATMDVLTNNYARDQTSSSTPSHLARTLFDWPSCWHWLETECKMHKFRFFIFCYCSSWRRNNAYIYMIFQHIKPIDIWNILWKYLDSSFNTNEMPAVRNGNIVYVTPCTYQKSKFQNTKSCVFSHVPRSVMPKN